MWLDFFLQIKIYMEITLLQYYDNNKFKTQTSEKQTIHAKTIKIYDMQW